MSEEPLFEIKSVKPLLFWHHVALADGKDRALRCALCTKDVLDTSTSVGAQGDLVQHSPCKAIIHQQCLSKFLTRVLKTKAENPRTCPHCKSDWNVDESIAFNVFTGN